MDSNSDYYVFAAHRYIQELITILFKQFNFVKNLFYNNPSEFIRSSIRFMITNIVEENDYLEKIKDFSELHKPSDGYHQIRIQGLMMEQIEETFYDQPDLRRYFNNKRPNFIRKSILVYIQHWAEIAELEKQQTISILNK